MRKPRRNPQPQPNVATERQFVEAMEYVTAHNDTVQALYGARSDKGNCEPTTHRSVRMEFLPPPHHRAECLWEPPAAAWLGVGYLFKSL